LTLRDENYDQGVFTQFTNTVTEGKALAQRVDVLSDTSILGEEIWAERKRRGEIPSLGGGTPPGGSLGWFSISRYCKHEKTHDEPGTCRKRTMTRGKVLGTDVGTRIYASPPKLN